MINLLSLLKDTGAYKTVKSDRENNRLSHAYLILTPDGENLIEYLKIFSALAVCDQPDPCGECRNCKLIKEKMHPDVFFYPKEESVTAEQVTSLIEESFIRPIESDKKIFVINNAQTMNASAQNKLLKTLEEPPKGVHIFIGATSEFPLLSTVKSRVKKLEIPAFSKDKLLNALKDECPDFDLLSTAIACADGTVGMAKALYGDENLRFSQDLALSVLTQMKSSSDLLEYSFKVSKNPGGFNQFVSVLELMLRDLLVISEGKGDLCFNSTIKEKLKKAERFNRGAILHALEAVTQVYKRKKFNANATMLTEWLLFQILEGKYKWQKL